jgi:hypothetical protein
VMGASNPSEEPSIPLKAAFDVVTVGQHERLGPKGQLNFVRSSFSELPT